MSKLRELWLRDPWLVARYVAITLLLGILGKVLLAGAKDGADVPTLYAQFVPMLPMMLLTFMVHKRLWGHPEASLGSYIGGRWSASYAAQLVAGHAAFTVFAVMLGWQYLLVSSSIGFASMLVTFTVNQWKIFHRAGPKTSTP